jgi:hypothetical protein
MNRDEESEEALETHLLKILQGEGREVEWEQALEGCLEGETSPLYTEISALAVQGSPKE